MTYRDTLDGPFRVPSWFQRLLRRIAWLLGGG